MLPKHLALWVRPSAMVSFGAGALSVAVALGIAWWLQIVLHAAAPVVLFLCAVILLGLLSAAHQSAAQWLRKVDQALQEENFERRLAEERLQQLLGLLDLTYDAISVRDMNDVITYWNRGAEQLYGWTKEEAVGQVCHRLVQTVCQVPREQIGAQLLGTGRWEGELIQVKRGETTVVVSTRWALQRDESGNPVTVLEATNDITERKHAEESLRHSEAYLAEAQRLSHAGSWAIDPATGEVIHASEELFRLWGLDQRGGVKPLEAFRQRIHPEDRNRYLDVIQAAILKKRDVEVEYRAALPDGVIKHIHTVAHPVFTASGRLVEIVGTSLDITERKRAEDALRDAQAELARVNRIATLGTLVASIAHEVNQPLGAIANSTAACSRWLARHPPDPLRAEHALDRIRRDCQRASDVVARVRRLVRRQPPQDEPVDLNEAIHEVLALVRKEVEGKGVSLSAQLAHGLPRARGDRVQLQQVILNLIVNAIEAMSTINSRPRELVIRSRGDASRGVIIAVLDSGSGLEAADTDHLFDAFYTTKPDGIGMGLAISRSIIDAHGGRLWAVPNAPHGAVFQFLLPAEPLPTGDEAADSASFANR